MSGRRGFTLIEILVVLSVVLVLACLIFPAWQSFQAQGDRVGGISQMRQIGLALFQYAGDQGGRLPGPMKSGQGARYRPAQPDQLATALGMYLGVSDLEQDSLLRMFLPPALVRAMGRERASSANPFVMNISAKANGQGIKPWGSSAAPVASPMLLSAITPGVWAFCDADQLHPLVAGQPWASKTPSGIIHGTQRLALYFDGRVMSISETDFAGGGGPPGPPPPPPPPPPPR